MKKFFLLCMIVLMSTINIIASDTITKSGKCMYYQDFEKYYKRDPQLRKTFPDLFTSGLDCGDIESIFKSKDDILRYSNMNINDQKFKTYYQISFKLYGVDKWVYYRNIIYYLSFLDHYNIININALSKNELELIRKNFRLESEKENINTLNILKVYSLHRNTYKLSPEESLYLTNVNRKLATNNYISLKKIGYDFKFITGFDELLFLDNHEMLPKFAEMYKKTCPKGLHKNIANMNIYNVPSSGYCFVGDFKYVQQLDARTGFGYLDGVPVKFVEVFSPTIPDGYRIGKTYSKFKIFPIEVKKMNMQDFTTIPVLHGTTVHFPE